MPFWGKKNDETLDEWTQAVDTHVDAAVQASTHLAPPKVPKPAKATASFDKARVMALLDAAVLRCQGGEEFGHAQVVALRKAVAALK